MECASGKANGNFRFRLILAALVVATSSAFGPTVSADPIKIGTLKVTGAAALLIAQDKGYFAEAGVPAELVYFDASQPIAVAVASGAVQFGITGFTAGFYSLAGQGALKVIAGGYSREMPGFHNLAYIASTKAFEHGLKGITDLPGHSVAISQVGSPPHYALGLLIEKYRWDPRAIRILPLQSIPNMVSAVQGGQADAAVLTAGASLPLVGRKAAKLLGWVGDETPWELGAVFTSTVIANTRPDMVQHFLLALREGARDCHEAFADKPGKGRDSAASAEALAVITKYTGLTLEAARTSMPYCDAEARLDVGDVKRQVAWYQNQGMLERKVTADAILDPRYVKPSTEH